MFSTESKNTRDLAAQCSMFNYINKITILEQLFKNQTPVIQVTFFVYSPNLGTDCLKAKFKGQVHQPQPDLKGLIYTCVLC